MDSCTRYAEWTQLFLSFTWHSPKVSNNCVNLSPILHWWSHWSTWRHTSACHGPVSTSRLFVICYLRKIRSNNRLQIFLESQNHRWLFTSGWINMSNIFRLLILLVIRRWVTEQIREANKRSTTQKKNDTEISKDTRQVNYLKQCSSRSEYNVLCRPSLALQRSKINRSKSLKRPELTVILVRMLSMVSYEIPSPWKTTNQ